MADPTACSANERSRSIEKPVAPSGPGKDTTAGNAPLVNFRYSA